MFQGKIVVVKYHVHWSGWPNENDSWELPRVLDPEHIAQYLPVLAEDEEIEDM
jgi:hypothetical protein